MPVETISFLENLRSTTSESHKNLEKLPLSAAILSPTISKNDYGNYLKVMYDVIYETENRIFPILSGLIPDLEERKKARLLDQDLAALGMSKSNFESPFASKENVSIGFALGLFYVVEGSTLGGRFIIKNIQSVLGFDENNGAQYFAGYGNKTGSYWKNFLNILTQYEQENEVADEIIDGANFAFNAIHDHFLAQSHS